MLQGDCWRNTDSKATLEKRRALDPYYKPRLFFLDISEGKEGKIYEYYTCLWVTFAHSKTPSPEPPAAGCSHGPPAYDFGEAQKKMSEVLENLSG